MPESNRKRVVRLSSDERAEVERKVRAQNTTQREKRRAEVLLLSDVNHLDGQRGDAHIAERVGISLREISRIRRRFVDLGLDAALARAQRSDAGVPKVIDGKANAHLISLCCSETPAGRQRWTLQLLVDELGRLSLVGSVCRETVRRTLKKTGSSLGGASGSAFPREIGLASSAR